MTDFNDLPRLDGFTAADLPRTGELHARSDGRTPYVLVDGGAGSAFDTDGGQQCEALGIFTLTEAGRAGIRASLPQDPEPGCCCWCEELLS
jgi:hypothetical protein